ncbi:MAG: ABC transporter ATP-binding protein [bacterium]
MATVILKNIKKIYPNGFEALNGIDLEIKDGELMALVGPSGCAKSTLLRLIAGLEDSTGGELIINEKIVNNVTPAARNIAMVFQDYALYPHMTVYNNMAYGLQARRFSKLEIKKRIYRASEILGISEYLTKKPKHLSGGQRQRVAIGRVIVREPQVFLFDEPLSNLDAKLRVHMRAEIIKIQKSLGTTMIYVTHDQVEAMTMGDRICVMNEGRIMQTDKPMEIYDHPVNKFVATFIGSPSMNIIKGRITSGDHSLLFETEGIRVKVPEEQSEIVRPYRDKELEMGIRPEHISIAEAEVTEENRVQAEIILTELMGNEKIIHAKNARNLLIVRADPYCHVHKGEIYSFVFDTRFCHFFNLETQLRLKNL